MAWQVRRSLPTRRMRKWRGAGGYAMVALLVGLSVMAVMLSVALPTWRTLAQRERESELVFRGQQYARAISLFQRKYANAFPPTIDLLVDQKFLRKKYVDPVTGGEFQVLYVGQAQDEGGTGRAGAAGQQGRGGSAMPTGVGMQGSLGTLGQQTGGLSAQPLGGRAGILGVTSKSDATSFREYNGRTKYNEWTFVATEATTRAGAPSGSQNPTGGIGGAAGGRGTGEPGQGGGAGTLGSGGRGQGGENGGRRGGGNPSSSRPNQPFGGSPSPRFGGTPPGGRF